MRRMRGMRGRRAIEYPVVKTAWILSNSFIPQEMGRMRGMRRMRTERPIVAVIPK